jgi:hypothetical protein
MSKLKKIMGTGAVITVLFAAPITVINQPTPALSQTVQLPGDRLQLVTLLGSNIPVEKVFL